MPYLSSKLPALKNSDAQALASYLENELQALSSSLVENIIALELGPTFVPPDKPRQGMIVYADGTKWNPGSGEGPYAFGSDLTWHPLENPTPPTPPPPPRGLIAGLTISAAGGTGTFGVSSGVATDSTFAQLMTLSSAFTKTTANWVVGTGNGGLDSGAIANSTSYHFFLIEKTDLSATDIIFSLSPTAPTLPSGWTFGRRIASMKTDTSAHWLKISQVGDEFLLDTPTQENGGINNTTVAITITANVPTGIEVWILPAFWYGAGATNFLLISSLDSADVAPSTSNFSGLALANAGWSFTTPIRSNTSGQYRFRASVNGTANINSHTRGWIDTRGRFL